MILKNLRTKIEQLFGWIGFLRNNPPASLHPDSDVYRAIRKSWVDNITGELTTAAFFKRDPDPRGVSPDAEGLSVSTDSIEHCRTTLTNPYGVASLTVRCVQGTGLGVIPDVPKHANIDTSLPLRTEDLRRAEYLAGKLRGCAKIVWQK